MRLRVESKQEKIDREARAAVEASNRKRELDRQRGFISQLDLDLHYSRERAAELRREAEQIESGLPKRERKLAQERARLAQLESA